MTKIGRGGHDYRQIGVEEDLVSGGFSVRSTIMSDMKIRLGRNFVRFKIYLNFFRLYRWVGIKLLQFFEDISRCLERVRMENIDLKNNLNSKLQIHYVP